MHTTDITFATAGTLAAAIRRRACSAAEVLEAHLAQIARHNPALNAIVTLDEEGARQRAREADAALAHGEPWGPLHGVPVTIKDSLETAGLRTTAGFPPLADNVPAEDASVVARLRAAGAVILGKTNLPPLAGDVQTDNPLFGRTNNPWDHARTPGGSTGGGAAAVAADLTPLEIGSDIGGSVRIPAHWCGICALKPTDGRVPLTGHIPEPPGAPRGVRHMAVVGPLARSVADLALALDVLAGPDGRRWETPPVPLLIPPDRPLPALRLAWTDDPGGLPVAAETRAALADLATELSRRGASVARRWPPDFDASTALETWGELFQAESASAMPPEAEEETAAWLRAQGAALNPMARGRQRRLGATMRQYTATLTRRDALIGGLERFFDDWDALLCPVAAVPAIPHCPGGTPVLVDGIATDYSMALTAHCMLFNTTGHPAVVIPLTRSADGLPIGVQIVGRRWQEPTLLAIAGQLAEVIGPWRRPPGL